MTPRSVRLVRVGLLATLLLVGLSVALTLRKPRVALPPSAPSGAAPTGAPLTEEVVFRSLKGDALRFILKAKAMAGNEQQELHLRHVDHTFHYTAQGKAETGRIVADEGVYFPTKDQVVFQGNVHLVADAEAAPGQGFELFTDQLIYDKGVATSEYPLRFMRKDASGEAKGLRYETQAGLLQLLADVVLRLADPDQPPAEIKAARAELNRVEHGMRFLGGVHATQGADVLDAETLELEFTADQAVSRVRAIDRVDLKTQGGAASSGALLPGGGGARRLTAEKLDLWYRPNRVLQGATAGPEAELTIEPGPKDPPERRRIQGDFLFFNFDEQGRLADLRAEKSRNKRDSRVDILPIGRKPAPARSVKCRSFTAFLLPGGEIRTIEFSKEVEFVEGPRRATADRGDYDGKSQLLTLRESPELVDSEQGSTLTGGAIYVNAQSGDVLAGGGVKHVLQRRAGSAGGLLNRDEPALVTSRGFEWVARTRTASYREEALLRTGKDEIRAPEIRLQDSGGQRRLEADKGVVSRLHPRSAAGADKPPAPVEARAREMVYEEAARRIRYKGEVSIRQGDIVTRSPEATLRLTQDGGGFEQLVAGEPVEVMQGERRARGARATYNPEDETMTLVGERVTMQDASQRIEGRVLTFHVGEDRILVDGQEKVRTQTVIRKEPPRP